MTPSPASLVCRPAACYTSPPLWVAPGTSTERTVPLQIHVCIRWPSANVDFLCRDVPGARPRRFHWPRCNNNNNVGGLRLLRFTLTDLPFLRPSSPPNSHFAQNRVGLGARHARHRQLSPQLETRLFHMSLLSCCTIWHAALLESVVRAVIFGDSQEIARHCKSQCERHGRPPRAWDARPLVDAPP